MAYAMTKQGSLDNCVTYEFICDTIEDMNAIENRYRTIGSIAIVLSGSSGLEVYITGSDKQWNSLSTIGGSSGAGSAGLAIHICGQNEVSEGLPNVSEPDETTIYLVPAEDEESGNLYDEYIYVDDDWEKFGSGNTIDLTGYYQKPVNGIPASDLASGVIPDTSIYAPKDSPEFTNNISMGRKINTTIGNNSAAIGYNVEASGTNAYAEGSETIASGSFSHSEGGKTVAYGLASHAEGYETRAQSSFSHAEGESTVASGTGSHAEGSFTIANGNYSHAEGQGGASTTKTFNNKTYTGTGAYGNGSHAEGISTWAIGASSHTEGSGTVALASQSHAEGTDSMASGVGAHAEGMGGTFTLNSVQYTSEARGTADHIEGYQCLTASGQPGNHAEGFSTRATGGAAHAEGQYTLAEGMHSHAEGSETTASGMASHAEGSSSVASGYTAHAEGYYTTASGKYSHAEGVSTVASGLISHATGASTIASGAYQCVSGMFNVEDSYVNWPEWTASTSYAVGDKVKVTTTSSNNTTITGYICKTANNDSSFTSSKWINQGGKVNYIEIIGNGEKESARSNARALDWNGNEHLMGDIYVGCNADSTGGVKLPRIPEPPTTDGTYTLQVVVSNGIPTYSWV